MAGRGGRLVALRRAAELVCTWRRRPVSGSTTPRIPTAGKLQLPGVGDMDGDDLVAQRQAAHRGCPVGGVEEVGHHHDLTAPALSPLEAGQGRGQVGRRGSALAAVRGMS